VGNVVHNELDGLPAAAATAATATAAATVSTAATAAVTAATTAAAATTTAAVAAAAAAAAATESAAAWAFFTRTCFVYYECTTIDVLAIEFFDCLMAGVVVSHFDETKST
jgi:hypothetical protein